MNTALVNKAVPGLLVRPYCVSLAGPNGTVSRTFEIEVPFEVFSPKRISRFDGGESNLTVSKMTSRVASPSPTE